MTLLRVTVGGLIVLLVVGAFLGFAACDVTRHAGGQSVGPPRVAGKTTPGLMVPPPPPLVLTRLGRPATDGLLVAPSAALRPPFVPPRA